MGLCFLLNAALNMFFFLRQSPIPKEEVKDAYRARKSIVALILFSALLMTGCDHKLVKAATAAKDLAKAVHVVQDTEIAMYHQNLVDKDEHIAFQKLLIDVSNSGIELSNAILVLKSKPDASLRSIKLWFQPARCSMPARCTSRMSRRETKSV
jgi:hypothetical protein